MKTPITTIERHIAMLVTERADLIRKLRYERSVIEAMEEKLAARREKLSDIHESISGHRGGFNEYINELIEKEERISTQKAELK